MSEWFLSRLFEEQASLVCAPYKSGSSGRKVQVRRGWGDGGGGGGGVGGSEPLTDSSCVRTRGRSRRSARPGPGTPPHRSPAAGGAAARTPAPTSLGGGERWKVRVFETSRPQLTTQILSSLFDV